MACTVRFSPAAHRDLSNAWEYVSEHQDDATTREILRRIRDAVKQLVSFPELGSVCEEFDLAFDVRRLVVSGYAVYYRHRDETIEVSRILHERRHRESVLARWLETQRDAS
jgi:plasmid stabilization system protein ParE